MGKRAYGITNSEVSSIFWGISFIMNMVVIIHLYGMQQEVMAGNPGLGFTFMFLMFLCFIGMFFGLLSMALPNYMISKHNLNIWIDKISNPDFIGWLRLSRDKKARCYTVETKALGYTLGNVNGEKAGAINMGTFTLTLPNGNQMIVVTDMFATNMDINNAVHWNLINRHYGVFGFDAYNIALEQDELQFKLEEPKKDKEGKDVKKEK